jgi:hypothetical protein
MMSSKRPLLVSLGYSRLRRMIGNPTVDQKTGLWEIRPITRGSLPPQLSRRVFDLTSEAKSMVRRLIVWASSQLSELSVAGRRASLYSAFAVQRKLGDLRQEKPMPVFSATGSRRDTAWNAAKYGCFRRDDQFFSDISDLLAERQGFEPPVQFCNAKSRQIRKLQIACVLRENFGRRMCFRTSEESGFHSASIRMYWRIAGDFGAEIWLLSNGARERKVRCD